MSDDDQKLRIRLVGRNGRRRYEAASKERLVAGCLEPGVSVSRLALEHEVNANLLRKWIKKHTAARSLPPSSPSAFIPVQLEEIAGRALSRQDSVATVDLPAADPIDFRAAINSLAVLVQETMALDPFAPAVFAFCNRRCDRMKLLFFDRSGLCWC